MYLSRVRCWRLRGSEEVFIAAILFTVCLLLQVIFMIHFTYNCCVSAAAVSLCYHDGIPAAAAVCIHTLMWFVPYE